MQHLGEPRERVQRLKTAEPVCLGNSKDVRAVEPYECEEVEVREGQSQSQSNLRATAKMGLYCDEMAGVRLLR